MYKTVSNFQLKKINTKSAFMSSWWSGYFYHEWLFIDDMIWMTGGRWHVCYIPEILNMRTDIYWHDRTAEYMREFWIWVGFWLKKRGERLLLWTNMYTNERMNTIRLLIFFQTIIKTDPKITHDSTETMTVQNRSVTGHVIRYTFTLNVMSEMLNMRTCHWLSRWWYCRQRRPVTARNR